MKGNSREVYVVGIGQTAVGEHWEKSLRDLAVESILASLKDAEVEKVEALYLGNMLSGELAEQEHLAALVADYAGLKGSEALKVEAACASGGAALRAGYLAVMSGLYDLVLVSGAEKMTDRENGLVTSALAMAADAEFEAVQGISFVALNALVMRRYMHEYGFKHEDFAGFAINAHHNAAGNPQAMFQRPISEEDFLQARMIAEPINLLDSSPVADGAATLLLTSGEVAKSISTHPVRILASSVATDTIALHDRDDPLFLQAASASAQKAYKQAGVEAEDIDFFELHDAFSIMSALSLEACGFAPRGQGVGLAKDGEISIEGRIPISTRGGLKGRGHPVGASGVYQVVEVVEQLRGQAGLNQVQEAEIGMAQSLGGIAATAITHILARES
ncbi:MAG: thiolase domain-containing protein [Chloroflexi bacterium]|nr:thiolase domain-containing protein [Chloroflexota bacterium]